MATQMSVYPSFASRSAGIRVMLCEPDSAIRTQLRSVIDGDPLLLLAAECRTWTECEAGLNDVVPELLIIRSDLIASDCVRRIEEDRFFPLVIALRGPLSFVTPPRQYDELSVPADPDTIRKSLDRAVRDIYDRKAKQLLYLVDRYVAGSRASSPYKSVLKVERNGELIDLSTDKIMSIVAARKCVSIQSTVGQFMLREPIHMLASQLDPHIFIRIHRSVIINRRHVGPSTPVSGKSSYLVMVDGSRYPVGPNYREALATISSSKSL